MHIATAHRAPQTCIYQRITHNKTMQICRVLATLRTSKQTIICFAFIYKLTCTYIPTHRAARTSKPHHNTASEHAIVKKKNHLLRKVQQSPVTYNLAQLHRVYPPNIKTNMKGKCKQKKEKLVHILPQNSTTAKHIIHRQSYVYVLLLPLGIYLLKNERNPRRPECTNI